MHRTTCSNDPNIKGRVLLAIQAFCRGQFKSLFSAADSYDVLYLTVRDHSRGRKAYQDCLPNSRRLHTGPVRSRFWLQRVIALADRGLVRFLALKTGSDRGLVRVFAKKCK